MGKTRSNPIARRMDRNREARRFSGAEVDELLGEAAPETVAKLAAEENAPAPVRRPTPPVEIAEVDLVVPFAQFREEVRLFDHVEVRFTPEQKRAMRRLFDGLDESGARMANGKRVASAADCVRWILDRLGG